MSDYISMLKRTISYCSLKEMYTKEIARLYKNFDGDIRMTSDKEMDHYVKENWENIENDVPVINVSDTDGNRIHGATADATLKDKDLEINKLTKEVETLKEEKLLSVKERVAEVEKMKDTKERETEMVKKKLNQSRSLLGQKLKDFINDSCNDLEILESSTRLYVSMFDEDDFVIDDDVLKVSQSTFLDEIDATNLNESQTKTLERIQKYMTVMFRSHVMVRSRRVSVSLKRMKPDEFETLDPDAVRKPRKEPESSPKS